MPTPIPKRILYVITKDTSVNFGGAQRYVFELATAGKNRGFEVAVAIGCEGVLTKKLSAAGIPFFITSGLERDIRLTREWRALRSLTVLMRTWKPDVVHINSSKAGVLGTVAARLARVPRIVFTAHGWPFFEDRALWWKLLVWKLSWLTLLLSHVTICVSDFDATHTRFPFGTRKLVRVYNGVVVPKLLPRDEAQSKLLGEELKRAHEHDIHLVAIGELHPNKNLSSLLYALAVLKKTDPRMHFFLTIIGDGEERAQLEAEVATRNISKNVYFTGYIDEPYQYLAAFDALVMPSKKEGLPYTLLFALATGTPMIASRVGGIPEILATATRGKLINPNESATLLNALRDTYYEQSNVPEPVPHELGEFALARMVERTFAVYR